MVIILLLFIYSLHYMEYNRTKKLYTNIYNILFMYFVFIRTDNNINHNFIKHGVLKLY